MTFIPLFNILLNKLEHTFEFKNNNTNEQLNVNLHIQAPERNIDQFAVTRKFFCIYKNHSERNRCHAFYMRINIQICICKLFIY